VRGVWKGTIVVLFEVSPLNCKSMKPRSEDSQTISLHLSSVPSQHETDDEEFRLPISDAV
jgi:hypothetical protein